MPEAAVQHAYAKYRKQSFSPSFGITPNQPTASGCLTLARQRVWFDRNWDESRADDTWTCGDLRLRLVPDEGPYDPGDMFDVDAHAATVPGGARAIKAQERAFWRHLESDGVWGYILERRCPSCSSWTHLDSCYGFDDAQYCLTEAISAAFHHANKDTVR